MTSNIFMFPAYDRMMQVHEERKLVRTATVCGYFVISSEGIVPGDLPSADIIDLDIEREKRNS